MSGSAFDAGFHTASAGSGRLAPDLLRQLLPKTRRSITVSIITHWLSVSSNCLWLEELAPGWQHAAPLEYIGAPALPFPNVEDHAIERVIAALMSMTLKPAA